MRIATGDLHLADRMGRTFVLPLNEPTFFDTTKGPVSVRLPKARSGDVVVVIDEKGSFGSNPLTISGFEEGDMVVDVSFTAFSILFTDTWHVITSVSTVRDERERKEEEDRDSEERVAREVGRMARANLRFIGEE